MKQPKGFWLEETTAQLIDKMAEDTHRSNSAIVEMAIDLLKQQAEFRNITTPKRPTKKNQPIAEVAA